MPIDPAAITEPRLLNGVDMRALWETSKLRWWVLPATVLLVIAVLWAQESNLQTEPSSYTLIQTYEAQDPTPLMLTLGINPALVKQFPDPANQLLILQSSEEQEAVRAEIAGFVTLSVTKNPANLTYEFRCTEEAELKCDLALVSMQRRAVELRRQGYVNGLNELRTALVKLSETSTDASVNTTITAIDVLLRQLQTPFVLINEFYEEAGPTIATVRRSTYVFGVIAGLIIAVLILLQLTFSDTRIRSARQFSQLIDHTRALGWLPSPADDIALRRTAVALHHALGGSASRVVRFIPLRTTPIDTQHLVQLTEAAGVEYHIESAFVNLSVADITRQSSSEVDIIVVQRNYDRRRDLVEATSALERSGRSFGGAVLVG